MSIRPPRRPASTGEVVARVAMLIGLVTAAGLLAGGFAQDHDLLALGACDAPAGTPVNASLGAL
jgi:hypothetical protein